MKYNLNYYQQHTQHYLKSDLARIPSFAWIKKELAVEEREKVLDAGCGTGYLLDFVCDQKTRGVGIDISPDAIKTSQKASKSHRFLLADITHLPFGNNQFDKIVCFNVIEHIRNQNQSFKELKRVLKTGGVLVIGTNIKDSFSWRLFKLFFGGDPTHIKEFSELEFMDFVGHEFKILKVRRSSSIGRFPGRLNQIIGKILKGDILIKATK